MSETGPSDLQRHLLDQHQPLLALLTRRLGSQDLARDVLQDVYVKLSVTGPTSEVRSPISYLTRMALNVAANLRRREQRFLSFDEIDTLLEIPDRAPGPAQMIEARADIAIVKRAMAAMPQRRYEVCVASWMDGTPTADIAARHGLSIRTIQHELRQASLEIHAALNP